MGPFSSAAANRDYLLAQLAASQHGVVLRDQLLQLGFTDDLISDRLERTL